MQANELAVFELELRERRGRLESLGFRKPDSSEIRTLLKEVDDALNRLGGGSFGLCEHCHDPIEEDRLRADPLIRVCLDHLTPNELRALEEDLDAARSVQSALLPRARNYSGWEIEYVYAPKGVVSGDYCDVVQDDHRLLLLLGDVAGKGISASLLMSHLHAMFRSLCAHREGIDQMVERANRLLCEHTQQAHYATLVCVQIDDAGAVTVCNAGHCSPMLSNARGVSVLDSAGLPLGLFCNSSFPVTDIQLERGDALLLHSDGLSESENALGEAYGVDRVRFDMKEAGKLPTAKAILQLCMNNLKEFLGDAKPADDLTVMVVRRA